MAMNYFVVAHGHIAWFEQYETARAFARDFEGIHFNYWGLMPRNHIDDQAKIQAGRLLQMREA